MSIVATVDIPVPVFVQKYLEKRYGTDHKVNQKSLIGIMVIELASKYYMKPVKGVPECGGVYSLSVTQYYFNKKIFRIQRRKMQQLTKLLARLFYEDMVHSINRDIETGQAATARGALRIFLDYYEISESELKIDTAYMEYQRKRGKKVAELKKQFTQ